MKTTEPTRVIVVGDSAISTIPAARVSGAVPRCSQPRSLGLTSRSVSAIESVTESSALWTASPISLAVFMS